MADDREDRTARAIRERRERAGLGPQRTGTPGVPAMPAADTIGDSKPSPKPRLSDEQKAEIRREIESLKDRPILCGRRIKEYEDRGVLQKDIADALGVKPAWVSKLVALTQAPPEILQQIESGQLSVFSYHNRRSELTGGDKRILTMPITIEAGRAVAEILEHIAALQGAIPVRLEAGATKKQLCEIINHRAADLRSLFVKR